MLHASRKEELVKQALEHLTGHGSRAFPYQTETSESKGKASGATFESRTPVKSFEDIVIARRQGRRLAQALGFSPTRSTLVTTAISELARNIILYATAGEIILSSVGNNSDTGILITAIDRGPGIPSIQHAMMSGYSTSGGLGLGLPGVQHMADEFSIVSQPGAGTQVNVCMWSQDRLHS